MLKFTTEYIICEVKMRKVSDSLNKFTKDKKILFGIIIGIIFILSIGITYAWFNIVVKGNDEATNVTVETGTLSLHYKNGPKIEGFDILPGWTS